MASALEISVPALCSWRECRGGLRPGMQSVINVLYNRSKRDNTTMYAEAVKRLQFSSMTSPGDRELIDWPLLGDPQYIVAEQLSTQAHNDDLPDITEGATLYYAPSGIVNSEKTFITPDGKTVKFPEDWDQSKTVFTVEIANQLFFREN